MELFTNMPDYIKKLEYFVFFYPLIMSLMWIAGSIIFHFHREKKQELKIEDYFWPPISILIPCYNEQETIEETINTLSLLTYPDYEIIAVNDGSKDSTGEILKRLAKEYEKLRVINCHENKGKANALHMGANASRNEYLICIDSDALLDKNAPYFLIHHFLNKGERVGAVTGNPRIRNRDTLISRLQIVEYSSIIGAIKRTQRILGKVMTVSGVIVAFRKRALLDVGLWDRDMITEDIAISWKLQRRFWDIRYEPRALCWMLVPETIKGIWKQRVRWAQGGQEVVLKHFNIFADWKQRRLWPVYIEQIASIFWCFAWLLVTLYLIFNAQTIRQLMIWFTFNSFALIAVSHLQLIISVYNDSKYDNIGKFYLVAVWYPAIYWMLNTFVVMAAVPKSIRSRVKGGYATWDSPDRGNRSSL